MNSRHMGAVPTPWTAVESTPPPSPLSSSASNMTMLYYGLVVVGTAALVLTAYNLVVIRWCTRQPDQFSEGRRRRGLQNSDRHLLSSFRYKKDGRVQAKESTDKVEYECSVCLSVFEEGEEVKTLPRCRHSFHANCIDMWLYSHLDCPLCRQPVRPPCPPLLPTNASTAQSSSSPDSPV